MLQKIAKHRANDASNDVHRPPLATTGRGSGKDISDELLASWLAKRDCERVETPLLSIGINMCVSIFAKYFIMRNKF